MNEYDFLLKLLDHPRLFWLLVLFLGPHGIWFYLHFNAEARKRRGDAAVAHEMIAQPDNPLSLLTQIREKIDQEARQIERIREMVGDLGKEGPSKVTTLLEQVIESQQEIKKLVYETKFHIE